jgi:uncharacterized surface protein with fasciclin (FAS1) repeats
VYDVSLQQSDLTITATLLEAAGLDAILNCPGPFTGLFPTDAAWALVDEAILEELLLPGNEQQLQDLLLYHILPGATMADDFEAGPEESLLIGSNVIVSLNPLMFNNAGVVTADIEACNGIIHTINMVLFPGGKFIGSSHELLVC